MTFRLLNGIVRDTPESESRNFAISLEDDMKNIHYCFAINKVPFAYPGDEVSIIGTKLASSKIRIEYVYNKSRDSENKYYEEKTSWMYNVMLIVSIGMTIGFFISLIIVVSINPFYGGFNFNWIIALIFLIMSVIALIMSWPLTYLIYKSQRNSNEIIEKVNKMRATLKKTGPKINTTDKSDISEDSIKAFKECPSCKSKTLQDAMFCMTCGAKI